MNNEQIRVLIVLNRLESAFQQQRDDNNSFPENEMEMDTALSYFEQFDELADSLERLSYPPELQAAITDMKEEARLGVGLFNHDAYPESDEVNEVCDKLSDMLEEITELLTSNE